MESAVIIVSEAQWQALLDALSQLDGRLEALSYFLSVMLFTLLFALFAVTFWKTIFRE